MRLSIRCRKAWSFSSLVVLALLPMLASAQVTPVIFERTTIRIDSPPSRGNEAAPSHPSYTYNIEQRPEDAMRLEYIHTLNSLTLGTGVMIVFTAPSMVALPVMNVYTPVDALFITDNGTIEQILPNVVLGELNQAVMAHMPIKAFLFLKAGEVAARGIRPRDMVAGSAFTPAPPMME